MRRPWIRAAFDSGNTFVLQVDLRLARLCAVAALLALVGVCAWALTLPAQAAPDLQGPAIPLTPGAASGPGASVSVLAARPGTTPPCAGSPQSYSLPVNSGLTFTYSINPGPGTPSSILSFSVSATYNPAFLQVTKIEKGNFPGITNFQSTYNNTTGVYQASGSISPPSAPSPPNNTTVIVTFVTVGATPSTPLDSTLVTTDSSGTSSCEAILNLTITAPTPTATPACSHTASINTLGTDRACYPPGGQIGVFVGVSTSLGSQLVRAEALLLSGDVGVASAERTFLVQNTGSQVIPLSVPLGLSPGDYTVLVNVYDANSGCFQGAQSAQVHVDPACGTVTPVLSATPTRTPTYTPSPTATPTRTPTRTPTATPTPSPTATVCTPPRPEVTPSCVGTNYVRNPGFEKFNRSWGEWNTTGQEIVSSANAYDGFYSAYFDGPPGVSSHQLLYQFIDIPADATNASFWVEQKGYGAAASFGAPPPSGRDYFRVSLYDVTFSTELVRLWQINPLISPDCHQDPDGYNLSPGDLDLVRGRTVALVFEFEKVTTTGWSAFVHLDNIHFNVCAPSPPCGVGDDKTASPSVVLPGGDVAVTLTLAGLGSTCGDTHPPADVMLVIDRSGSMDGQKITDARAAAKGFVDRMDLSTSQVGLVSFSDAASLDQVLTQNAGPVRAAIDALVADGATNIADAITLAQGELAGPRHRPANQRALILMSDGQPTAGGDPRAAAAAAKAAGTRIFTIGLGSDVDPNLMRDLASAPSDYYYAPDSSQLDAIYQQIAGAIGGAAATNIIVIDRLSPNVTLVPNSFFGLSAPDISPDGRTLTWRIPRLGLETLRWGYHVTMTQTPGTWPTNTSATATYTNSNGQPSALTFPIPNVTVLPGQTGHPQLLCRDYEGDLGFLPSNPNGEAWWESPDIWVRNQPDGVPAQQNPIAGQTNYVYVRVHNTGDVTVSDITVHLYNTAASAGPRWPDDWAPEIGAAPIPGLAPGQDAVVSLPWTPPAQGHYCFLARIEAPASPITNDGWVPFDRQLCQKNMQIIGGSSSTTTIDVANPSHGSNYGAVSVSSSSIPSGGTTMVSMPPDLFQRWQGAGGTVSGGQVVPGTSSIQLDVQPGPGSGGAGAVQATISRIPLQGDESRPLTFTVSGAAGAVAPVLEVRETMNGQIVGGNLISPPQSPPYRIFLPLLARDAD